MRGTHRLPPCSSFLLQPPPRFTATGAVDVQMTTPGAGAPTQYTVTLCPPGARLADCKTQECARSPCGPFTGLLPGVNYTVTATASLPGGGESRVFSNLYVPAASSPTLTAVTYLGSGRIQGTVVGPSQGPACTSVREAPAPQQRAGRAHACVGWVGRGLRGEPWRPWMHAARLDPSAAPPFPPAVYVAVHTQGRCQPRPADRHRDQHHAQPHLAAPHPATRHRL